MIILFKDLQTNKASLVQLHIPAHAYNRVALILKKNSLRNLTKQLETFWFSHQHKQIISLSEKRNDSRQVENVQ